MTRSTLIRNAQVVMPKGVTRTNVLLRDGRIASVDASPSTGADEIVDATGLVLFPGLIDD
ncbi:MAG: dihydroorotase, partial [Planctomycetes bacterium]|nr:dihydroorotase [Planctomycetota bacterium]